MRGGHVLAGNIYVNASFCRRLALSASGFSPAPKLGKGHRFLEHSARRAVIQGLVQSFMIVEIENSGNAVLRPAPAVGAHAC